VPAGWSSISRTYRVLAAEREGPAPVCGLLTFVGVRGDAEARREEIAAALESIHHRGPDETGVEVVADNVVLADKRLSIIDIAGSHLPMRYAGGRYLLSYNGEIYNYVELRDRLIRECGARFETDGDAEVILAGYHHWGEAVLDRLRGMFAFVIVDTARGTAFGARDPFGIKPMYSLSTSDGLYLASEKKALLPFAAGARVSPAALSHYLTLQYVPEPGTMHCGIDRIGAGECFRYLPGGPLSTRRYYRPSFHPARRVAPRSVYAQIREALRDSVRIHMRSDVPVGAFLSSGIDSTAVVALAREVNPRIQTFTVGYDVAGYSEIDLAERTARELGVTIEAARIGPAEMMDALPKILWYLDDPVADPSVVPLYFLARTAARRVTVALSGEGADELFGGYTIYREPRSLAPIAALPARLRHGLLRLARVLPGGLKGRSFLERGATPIRERYYGNARMFSEAEKQQLLRRYDPRVRYTDVTRAAYAQAAAEGVDEITAMQYVDLNTWLRGDILVKADRMSMAHSLELRVPYLDRRVFAAAANVPVDLRLPPRSRETKHALRAALRGVVPPSVVDRPKLGFPTPTRLWLAGEMYDWAHEMIAGSGAGELLDLDYAHRLLDQHRAGGTDLSRKAWTVLAFCVWHAIFVTGTLDPLLAPAAAAHRGTGRRRPRPQSSA
jgi:asparagine synthase (glutamine-hydrolysing)